MQRGARLGVNNFAGEVVVRTWDKDAVRVQASHSSRERIDIRASETLVRVRATSRMGPSRSVDYQVTVPPWMPVRVEGTYNDIVVEGAQGEVTAENVRGDIRVKGGAGQVSAKSVEGRIFVEGSKGRISANTVNEGISITAAAGEITAETINGNIVLLRSGTATRSCRGRRSRSRDSSTTASRTASSKRWLRSARRTSISPDAASRSGLKAARSRRASSGRWASRRCSVASSCPRRICPSATASR